jgi:hypothetical protein
MGVTMPASDREERFGKIALEKGYITESQLDSVIDAQMNDEIWDRKHRVISTILFHSGYLTIQQIDEVLQVMEQDLS